MFPWRHTGKVRPGTHTWDPGPGTRDPPSGELHLGPGTRDPGLFRGTQDLGPSNWDPLPGTWGPLCGNLDPLPLN